MVEREIKELLLMKVINALSCTPKTNSDNHVSTRVVVVLRGGSVDGSALVCVLLVLYSTLPSLRYTMTMCNMIGRSWIVFMSVHSYNTKWSMYFFNRTQADRQTNRESQTERGGSLVL